MHFSPVMHMSPFLSDGYQPPTMFVSQRQRKYHRRSRNGCVTCKKRHVRCDEGKPLWKVDPHVSRSDVDQADSSNCLRSGGECGYANNTDTPGLLSASSSRASKSPSAGCRASHSPKSTASVVESSPYDFFADLPVELSDRSRWLFHTFVHRRMRDGGGREDSFVVRRAVGSPGYLHASLLLAAVEYSWAVGSSEAVKLPLLHHKLEAFRFVSQQLRNPVEATSDATVATVAALALLESTYWESNSTAMGATVEHLNGLKKVVELRLNKRFVSGGQNLFQRMVTMATRNIMKGDVGSKQRLFTEAQYQPPCVALLFVSLWPVPKSGWWTETCLPPGRKWFECIQAPACGSDDYAYGGPVQPSSMPLFIKNSRTSFMTCYIYLTVLLEHGPIDFFILNWLIEMFLEEAGQAEECVRDGSYNRTVWFWTMMFALSAVASGEPKDEMERRQLVRWKQAFYQKVRLGSSLLRLRDWNGAKSVLRRIAWADGFEGEGEMRRMWEEAVWGNGSSSSSSR